MWGLKWLAISDGILHSVSEATPADLCNCATKSHKR